MSKIYGFGNALIDIEIQINEAQLTSIGISKGSMQHITRDEKDFLLNEYKDSIKSMHPGGSIANSLHAAENYDASTCFSCSLGDDEYGQLFLSSYEDKNKIFFNYSDDPTGVCLVFISPDGERTMASNLSANHQLSSDCISPSHLETCEYLLFDNFSLATDSGNQTVDYCLDRIGKEVKVCFGIADSGLIIENLNKVKKLRNTNLYCLSGNQMEHDELDVHLYLNYQNRLVSDGKSGAMINEEKVNAPNINLVNTNGAGDALLGAYLALESKLGKLEALREAVNYASKICSINTPRLT
ncbi:MAG TPA: PfkB family carbohydrate kinase [SAR86 cluster bacterium]|jgi:sugar/nucleoside kinase (ribokinase family)|nr:PfkB family carbohydrate kinase [SAR86 cluster bacterium]